MNHRAHWENVRALKCCLSHTDQSVTIHHCKSGSMVDYFGQNKTRADNHFLVIPLAEKYHTGEFGIDAGMGVRTWEMIFSTQVAHLCWVNEQLDYDIFDLAEVPTPEPKDRIYGL